MNKTQLRQTAEFTHAYRIVDTLVLRTMQGDVFKIEVGESLLENQNPAFGSRVTLQVDPPIHIGFCQAGSFQEVLSAAEDLVTNAPVEQALRAPIPKPHFRPAARVST